MRSYNIIHVVYVHTHIYIYTYIEQVQRASFWLILILIDPHLKSRRQVPGDETGAFPGRKAGSDAQVMKTPGVWWGIMVFYFFCIL